MSTRNIEEYLPPVKEDGLNTQESVRVGSTSDRVEIKGIYMGVATVAVPSITDPDTARVQVDVSTVFGDFQPTLGDIVIVSPKTALPTASRLSGAYVYQTDGVEISFTSEGGNVTGANRDFNILVLDVT